MERKDIVFDSWKLFDPCPNFTDPRYPRRNFMEHIIHVTHFLTTPPKSPMLPNAIHATTLPKHLRYSRHPHYLSELLESNGIMLFRQKKNSLGSY